ncbi:aminoglycoside 2'-N-acetyltransferase I [Streptomyces griseochromogenes]|uniref:Aminoglycoside 2'-N-acetyltransferase n=1 Tax=Streptomyces griseochromogenes TaxID=68214 RepID=A0A1B1AT10_9ACTN|nr:GNAT family N-acetyltransferase [Streptomyces griseochromogenes]ANP49670.1 aminoglycoside 2'-N-acetyltransferase [Streptomyces griseochromogenes]MBP2051867.1 aminoglycoside 2'-N-acetyltransferase I [Streptomyces griseochromogenes]
MAHRLRLAHTADLDPAELHAARSLLDTAFEGGFSAEDWDHGLGGLHVLVQDGAGLAAHGAVVMRRIRHRGRWLRTGYVEAVAVRPDARRKGLGGRVLGELERVIERAYDLGALSASPEGALLYTARGWQRWAGQVHGLSPDGIVRLPEEEGDMYVWPALAGPLDPAREFVLDWRDGDVA